MYFKQKTPSAGDVLRMKGSRVALPTPQGPRLYPLGTPAEWPSSGTRVALRLGCKGVLGPSVAV